MSHSVLDAPPSAFPIRPFWMTALELLLGGYLLFLVGMISWFTMEEVLFNGEEADYFFIILLFVAPPLLYCLGLWQWRQTSRAYLKVGDPALLKDFKSTLWLVMALILLCYWVITTIVVWDELWNPQEDEISLLLWLLCFPWGVLPTIFLAIALRLRQQALDYTPNDGLTL